MAVFVCFLGVHQRILDVTLMWNLYPEDLLEWVCTVLTLGNGPAEAE